MNNKKEIEKELVECPKCKHQFLTIGKLELSNCNGCGKKFKRKENIIRPRGQKELRK